MKSSLLSRTARPLLAALVGLCTTFAFAPYAIWPLAIISPAILLLLLANQSGKRGFWIGYGWGMGLFGSGISWVHVSIDTFGGMPKMASLALMVLLIGYLAIYPAIFGALLNRLFPTESRRRYFLAAPALWLLTDWARGWVMTGFPWLWLGYSQIDSPLANFAPLAGVELITLIVMLASAAIALAVSRRQPSLLLIPAVLLSTGFGLKQFDWVSVDQSNKTSVALIQGNIAQAQKWLPSQRWPTIMKYTDLTRDNWDADIIIWPEAAVPAFEFEISSFLTNLDSAARYNDSAVITGILNQSPDKQYYNSVLAVGNTPDGEYQLDYTQRYHKYHLLPFGEFVPFEQWLRDLAPFFNLPMSSFTAGEYIQPNVVANGRHMVAALCYEIIFNEQLRDNVTDQTDFILTLSNDAWFGRSIGPLQHMEIARLRALELGKPLIRSTNNGVTAVTDHRGNIIKQLPQFTTGVLRAELYATEGKTPYLMVGRWPLYIWVLLALVFAGWLSRRKLA
ncbi:apolipoprotein N-acyltransferase [Vibrio sp.]|uniref:apolipoprotein N-acyltransferase n=1 Tax=Vibrio sp. TaxID=678 RepID=UPI003D104D93